MSIQDTLLKNINFSEYIEDSAPLKDFLNLPLTSPEHNNVNIDYKDPFIEKQKKAKDLIKDIMTKHGKEMLYKPIAELARVEYDSRKLAPEHRDHVVHALNTFILGIYINQNFFGIDNCVKPFQWKLASLFHDIGYPIEFASRHLLRSFEKNINRITKSLGLENENLHFEVLPHGFEILKNGKNSFELINKRLEEWEIKIDAKKVYDDLNKSGDINHGIISSLTVLKVIDLIYDKYNPGRKKVNIYQGGFNCNQKLFEDDIISACSAIYIHDLPGKDGCDIQIYRSKAPIAFLLRLSDCLQEWERPSFENLNGFSPAEFDIEIKGGCLILHANIPHERKIKIKNDINKSLICSDVEIDRC